MVARDSLMVMRSIVYIFPFLYIFDSIIQGCLFFATVRPYLKRAIDSAHGGLPSLWPLL